MVVTSDVSDFGVLPDDARADIVLLYDDTMPAHPVASALIGMIDAYPDREAFSGREELKAWA